MNDAAIVDLARNALLMAVTLAAPMLMVALVVGLLVSIVQAVTQIQEQTLSFVPKLVAVFVVLAAGPFTFMTKGNQQNLVTLFIYIILGTMWNLLAGYAGMVSIGQQAFIGIGAYGIVYASDLLGLGPFVGIPVALVISGVIAYLVSFLAFRLSGGYFAIGTWVIAEVIKLLTTQVDALGAGAGISLARCARADSLWSTPASFRVTRFNSAGRVELGCRRPVRTWPAALAARTSGRKAS